MTTYAIPDGLPVLSRGKHRSPRKGACFMEMASVLANEPWSDRPQCTHPLLAQLARLVNDHTSDAGRAALVVLIPEVIGVQGGGLEWEVELVAAVAGRVVRDVPEESQHALAAGLIRCDQLVPSAANRAALAEAPHAAAWARSFIKDSTPLSARAFRKYTAPAVLRSAVRGLAVGAVADPDGRLLDLLRTGLESARRSPVGPVDHSAWATSPAR
jgi:hypothetical protein